MQPPIPRHPPRTLLLHGLAAVAVIAAALAVERLLLDGEPELPSAGPKAEIVELEIGEDEPGRPIRVDVVRPRAGPNAGRPLLLFVVEAEPRAEDGPLQRSLGPVRRARAKAPIVAFPDLGGGVELDDVPSYVTDELLPRLLRRYDADRERVAIGGSGIGEVAPEEIAAADPGAFCAVARSLRAALTALRGC